MQGVTSKETHFQYVCDGTLLYCPERREGWGRANTCVYSVTITSSAFQSKMQPARHRMVYTVLKDEISREGGIHALQLRTRTPEEEEREKARQSQA
jgi:stress-induced morphogen